MNDYNKAIAYFDEWLDCYYDIDDFPPDMTPEIASIALVTLKARQRQQEQPNEPLTLEELLDIQEPTPLWIVSVGGDFKPHWSIECWIDSLTLFEILDDNSTNTMSKRNVKSTYGKIWLAYRRKPEWEAR